VNLGVGISRHQVQDSGFAAGSTEVVNRKERWHEHKNKARSSSSSLVTPVIYVLSVASHDICFVMKKV
jgi:hypothetical protein